MAALKARSGSATRHPGRKQVRKCGMPRSGHAGASPPAGYCGAAPRWLLCVYGSGRSRTGRMQFIRSVSN